VDLAGYFLTDNLTNKVPVPHHDQRPHTIPAGGYLLVWADEETGQNVSAGVPRTDLHVNFRLAQASEAIGLFAADGTQIDAITFVNQADDVSEGRFPAGTDEHRGEARLSDTARGESSGDAGRDRKFQHADAQTGRTLC
jgi:hypothetical protein